ncbi:glycosyltransferase [Sphingomonas montana]|uniref:glycosyltransferase n=1 Tax=Sphingomonas montana TaxID=1843236 RepID=UPI0009FB77E7|nr:glycosyltransferase [Sphingomonas montana]
MRRAILSDRTDTAPTRARRPTILFVINSIGSGGAERVLDNLLRAAGARHADYALHLVLLDREPEMRVLPALTGKHVLDARGGLWRSAIGLRRVVRTLRPDLVVSLLVRANIATAALPAGQRRLLCERMHLGSHLAGRYHGWRLRLLRALPRLLYPRATCILAVSEGVRRDLIDDFGLAPGRIATINNPYDLERIAADALQPPAIALPASFAVAVGRLVDAKGFDLLIDAYRTAGIALPLVILGDGPARPALEAQIAAAGLQTRILLPGFLDNPFAIVGRAAFLVSASRNEGFPNGMAEAMALGRAVLATDCPSGPGELLGGRAGSSGMVVDAPFGLIVGDGDRAGLAAGLRRLADDAALRARLGTAARARMEDFRADRIAADYWALFDRLVAGDGSD